MFKPHKARCSCHGLERWVLNKKLECRQGINERRKNKRNPSGYKEMLQDAVKDTRKRLVFANTGTKNGKIKRKTSIVSGRKTTGERIIFEEIWQERDPWCEWCGKGIIEFSVANYHHIKPKSKFPELRLDKNNIVKICFECHFKEHNK